MPGENEAVFHVGVGRDEGLRGGGRFGAEEEDRSIGRVGEGAGEHEIAGRLGLPGQGEVLFAVRGATLEVGRREIVEEEKVHVRQREMLLRHAMDTEKRRQKSLLDAKA